MVVEEVGGSAEPVEEIKEKVEELHDLTEDISESVEKSEEVQEEIVKTAEETVGGAQEYVPPSREPSPNEPASEIRNGGPNPMVIIIPGIFLLGALLGGIYFYQKGIAGGATEPTPTPQVGQATPTPVATPYTQIDLTKYPVNIKNGSGIAGQAGVVKTLLSTAGFSVTGTGNATSYDFTKTVIKAKASVPAAFLTQLSASLSKSYVLDTNQSLATSSADEVEVIVGSTKAK